MNEAFPRSNLRKVDLARRIGQSRATMADTALKPLCLQDMILRLHACKPLWCLLEKDRHEGWAPKADLWGVDADEVFE